MTLSLARYDTDERDPVPYARCRKQPGDVYTRLYSGNQRAPLHADEKGAIAVVECVFGGRVRIYSIQGDKEFRRVELDHDWRRA